MANYLKFRIASYLFILLGVGAGFAICEVSMEISDYSSVWAVFITGFTIGECIMIRKWLRRETLCQRKDLAGFCLYMLCQLRFPVP